MFNAHSGLNSGQIATKKAALFRIAFRSKILKIGIYYFQFSSKAKQALSSTEME